ncbi:MAG TPA: IclR family transcriptional regulator [Acidimicrobiia bacterium]|nr:IclR family transcriptional regulator [Acidimicrobiia bacterium]
MTGGTKRSPAPGLAERIVRVIEAVIDSAQPVGPRGLARKVGIDRSGVGRLLQQLGELGVLERQPEGYVPGPRLFILGRILSALDTLPNAIRPLLGRLVAQYDETCYVCSLHGEVAVFTHEIQSSKPLRFVVELGRPVPLYAGAAGRAILAGLPRGEASRLIGSGPFPRLAPGTITEAEAVLAQAELDHRRGYAVSIEERVAGGASVASPFFDHTNQCQGSLVFTAPLTRFDQEQVTEIGPAMASAARELSRRIGYGGDYDWGLSA